MTLVRTIVATNTSATAPMKDAFVNTLYFNVSNVGTDPDYATLMQDLRVVLGGMTYNGGRYYDIRMYDMADAEPRPVKFRNTGGFPGTQASGVPQVALCLSYYADRNLPRQRGRIFTGPWATNAPRPTEAQIDHLITLATGLSDLGGANVDWSLYSPTTGSNTRINHAWVDDSWDIIRSRKLPATKREAWAGDG